MPAVRLAIYGRDALEGPRGRLPLSSQDAGDRAADRRDVRLGLTKGV